MSYSSSIPFLPVHRCGALMRWLDRDEAQRDERELCKHEALEMAEERGSI